MGRLHYGRIAEAWKGEASDFTPLLVERLDQLGSAIGVDLASAGRSEVPTAGGRRIDIVAQGDDGSEFVIENQYGRADHDHLTRGLAYAVARKARGLVVVAEEHRDEFRALAQYLNDLADHDPERGVAVWLVEARAVRVDDSAWAPLFQAVVEPNDFTKVVEQAKQAEILPSLDALWAQFSSGDLCRAAQAVLERWQQAGHRRRLGPHHVVLEARGPAASGIRTVVTLYPNGQVLVPFSSYAGQNSGRPIERLIADEFRAEADRLFGFSGSERQARTSPGWLTPDRVDSLLAFGLEVAAAYADANMQEAASSGNGSDLA
jgi:hypothetical protein